jgi:hypothetical protein
LGSAFHQRRYKAIEQERDLQARTVLALQERLRMHTQVVRNWGYFSDVVTISIELYAPLDEEFRAALGFGASDLIAVARCLTSTLERRTSARFKLLQRIFREQKINRIVRRYFRDYPVIEGEPEEFLRNIPTSMTREGVVAALLSHADLALPELLIFTSEDLDSQLGLSSELVSKILAAISLQTAALKEEDVERFFLSNPIWRSPIIRVGDAFFCAMPQCIFSHIHEVMRSLAETAGLKPALEDRRAAYLEKKVGSLLEAILPGARLLHGVKWRAGDIEYETDHIAAIDKTVVIVEDKSATLSAPGLRGAPDRVKRHVRELILDPSEQSTRLEAMIWRAKAGEAAAIASLSAFGIDFSGTECVVRISITLDDFSVLSSAERELKEASWIPTDTALAVGLNIADFQSVIDILERPAFFVHYFTERTRIQKAMNIFADEMDFLGFYLETGFNIWSLEAEKPALALTGMSRAMDRYYNSRDAGVAIKKPAPKLRPYFGNLIRTMEARAFPSWLGVAVDLLRSASYDEQKHFDQMLGKLKANVERNWRDPAHECSLVITPPAIRETVVVFYLFPRNLAHRRKEFAEDLVSKALNMSGRARCVLIGKNTDRWNDPYSFVLIAHAARENKGRDD